MNFERDFRHLLVNYIPLADLVGDRVSWSELPAARPRPLIVLWNVTRDTPPTMDARTGYAAAYLQVDCWGDTYDDARAAADEISGFLQTLQDVVDGDTRFQGVFLQGRQDGNEPALGSPAARYFRVRIDCTVHWSAVTVYLVGENSEDVLGSTVP